MKKTRSKWLDIDNGSTMFDFEQYYTNVAESMPQEGGRLVEIGVSAGRSLIFLCETLLNMGKSFRLIGVDNLDYGNAKQLNTIISNIGKAGVGEYIEFWAMSSLDASTMFPDGYLNHVFIDSSHKFEQTKTEARCWYRKLVHEGVLSGHDYFSEENPEVRQAVDEVVPADRLFTQETTHGSGIWGIRKNDNCPLI